MSDSGEVMRKLVGEIDFYTPARYLICMHVYPSL